MRSVYVSADRHLDLSRLCLVLVFNSTVRDGR